MRKVLFFFMKWIMIFFGVSCFAFIVPRLMPGDPVENLLISHQIAPTKENIKAVRAYWGLDRPLPKQYFLWIFNFVKGDWGSSLVTKTDIKSSFVKKLPCSLAIGVGGLLGSAVLAFFTGYLSALKNGGGSDLVSRFLSILSLTVPSFVLAVTLIYFLGVKFKLIKFFTGSGFASLMFATALMCLYTVGMMSRVVKEHFKEQMNKTHVRFAISRGFSPGYVLLRHTYKPVIRGLISVVISRLAWVIGGSAVLEFTFGIPGISFYLIDSMHANDYYVLQTYIMVLVVWMFLAHLALGLALRLMDGQMYEK